MTADDLVHIGSDTKAMTAVLVARLVQQGKLEWDSTIAGVLPSIADSIHPDFRDVTVADLLRHVAGLPANPANWSAFAGKDLRARRLRARARSISTPIFR
jgi:D-alanyl-D-alanine carboxypeptidase